MPENGPDVDVPEHVIQDFLNMLSQRVPDVVTALEALNTEGDLQRRHETVLNFLRFQLQSLLHDIDGVTLGIVTETPQMSPPLPMSAAAPPQGKAQAKPAKQTHSFGYDYLLLDAFRHRARRELPTSLSYLTKLATIYDPNVKRRSLSAKLNRWKNELGFVTYERSTNIQITPLGEQHRDELLPHVRDEESLDRITQAFKAIES